MRFSRNFMDIQEAWSFRIAFWWRGVGGQLSSEEHDELQEALQAARDDFLRWARPESWTSDAMEMHKLRGLLGRTGVWGHPPINRMNDLQVARAICDEIERGSLLFVPSRNDVERYIEEERKRREYTAAADDSPTLETVRSVVTPNQPASRVPASPATSLSNAQPFEYDHDSPRSDVIDLAARGVSEAAEAECFALYERDIAECTAYKSAMGGWRFMDACSQRAFQNYQLCRGY